MLLVQQLLQDQLLVQQPLQDQLLVQHLQLHLDLQALLVLQLGKCRKVQELQGLLVLMQGPQQLLQLLLQGPKLLQQDLHQYQQVLLELLQG